MNDWKTLFRWLIFAIVVAGSAFCVFGPTGGIRLGLDLAGGISFTGVVDEDALRAELKDADETLKDALEAKAAAEAKLEEAKANAADADVVADAEKELGAANNAIADAERGIESQFGAIMDDADERSIEVIRNRIDGLGVNEPLIVPGRDHRIIIEIPGADDEQSAKIEDQIRSSAKLKFHLVHKNSDKLANDLLEAGKAPEGYKIVEYHGRSGNMASKYYARAANYAECARDPDYKRRLRQFGNPGPRYSFMLEHRRLDDGREVFSPTFVHNRIEMEGDLLRTASVGVHMMDGNIVNLEFTSEGRTRFADITKRYAPNGFNNKNNPRGRQLAIVLDDTLYSAPELRVPILDGHAMITGSFTQDEAALLANVLKAGSLPAPIKIIEKRLVDPSLGKDAIRSGILASLIGGALVILFMLIYYRLLGFVADLALMLNLAFLPLGAVIIAGFFSAVHVTETAGANSNVVLQLPVLTMPGIAGIVLTIGMAVDANVLIFERIREEMRQGKSMVAAVAAGYDRAFLAIFDSNITTLLTGLILFVFGSGPIRGFAITLSAGIIVSMYTALVVTRMILKFCVTDKTKTISVADWFKFKPIDFIGKSRLAMTVSAVIIVITLGVFAIRCKTAPEKVLAIDFTGGTVMTYSYTKAPALDQMAQVLKAGGVSDAVVRTRRTDKGVIEAFEVKSGKDEVNGEKVGAAITRIITERFADSGIKVVGQEMIGSQIGGDLKRAATRAVFLALIGMLIYISVRFEFGFALGAVVALLHDVLITLGLFTLFGRQIGVTAIACFLTIVGYSVNDTIVISDRIREDLRRNPNMGFRELCNRSITLTLGRTMLTSLTTMLAILSLLAFGGGAVFDFALCMTIGVIAGTYSTIFVATPTMFAWYKGRKPGMAKAAR